MKIEDNRDNLRKFEELVVGDVFEYEGDYYMKIREVHDGDRKEVSYIKYNVISLDCSAGNLFYFDNNSVQFIDDVTLVLN